MLTQRQTIGHQWEWVCIVAIRPHVKLIEHNPIEPEAWVRRIENGADIAVAVGEKEFVEVECKANYAPVYPSWIMRDYIPRFISGAERKVVVTNNKNMFSRECLELLGRYGILLMSLDELIRYVKALGVTSDMLSIASDNDSSVCYDVLVTLYRCMFDGCCHLWSINNVKYHCSTLPKPLSPTYGSSCFFNSVSLSASLRTCFTLISNALGLPRLVLHQSLPAFLRFTRTVYTTPLSRG